MVNLNGGYARWLETAETLLAHLGPAERDGVFGGVAARVCRLDLGG